MTATRPAPPAAAPPERYRMLALVAIGQFLGMTLWFSASAAAPAIAAELAVTGSGVAWLTMAVQAGFVAGTLVSALLNLADVLNARRLFAIGCAVGAAANATIPAAESAGAIIALRFATGAALACVYPPGMKIVAGWFLERRGTALGITVGALTMGSAFPHLLSWAAAGVDWRTLMWASSGLAITGGALVETTVGDGPYVSASAPFDPHAIEHVIRDRGVRLATLGYLGHMWELYAMWTWIAAFAAASLSAAGIVTAHTGSLVAFVAIGTGAAGCAIAGFWADTWGKARVAGAAMLVSGVCAAVSGFVFGAAPWWLFALAIVWGFSVVADSAQFSALVSEFSPRTHVGTALTLQVCAGFLLTMISMRLVPAFAGHYGWRWAFVLLVPGPLAGVWTMARLASATSSGTLRTSTSTHRSTDSGSDLPSAARSASPSGSRPPSRR
ncbi:MAG TPA: MFS transporter [Vicinamibacterales bacterium]|jgi:MFS family permease|nr:MFS transporter [Vicinamibacterales bacterium]